MRKQVEWDLLGLRSDLVELLLGHVREVSALSSLLLSLRAWGGLSAGSLRIARVVVNIEILINIALVPPFLDFRELAVVGLRVETFQVGLPLGTTCEIIVLELLEFLIHNLLIIFMLAGYLAGSLAQSRANTSRSSALYSAPL